MYVGTYIVSSDNKTGSGVGVCGFEVGGEFGSSVHGIFLISFWWSAGLNDGVFLGVPDDVA